jgi:hypothetical protein
LEFKATKKTQNCLIHKKPVTKVKTIEIHKINKIEVHHEVHHKKDSPHKSEAPHRNDSRQREAVHKKNSSITLI